MTAVYESLAEVVARRLRGQLAERRISQKRFGELTGWGRGHIYQRLSGNVALNLAELEHIQRTAGIPLTSLLPSKNVAVGDQSAGWPFRRRLPAIATAA